MKKTLLALVAAVLMSTMPAAQAQWVVIDPTNLVQNIMTAARALEQINNQIRQLQNEAQMLTNQAKNLTSLDFSALNELRSALSATNQLLQQAQGLAFNLSQMEGYIERAEDPDRLSADFSPGLSLPAAYEGSCAHALLATAATIFKIALRLSAKLPPPHIPGDRCPSDDSSHGLSQPLFDHRFPRHQAETHAIIKHREASAGELHVAAVDPSRTFTICQGPVTKVEYVGVGLHYHFQNQMKRPSV